MADSSNVKKRDGYDQWTKEESNVLLEIMVDAANQGQRVNKGFFTKQTVLDKILPSLNSKLGCTKNYKNYQSRLKWFKNRWLSYSTLLNFNPEFGYDSTSKKFTAPNEVWDDYLKAHPKDGNLRNGTFGDFEDLKMIIGGGVVVGKNSTRLGVAETKKLESGEVRDMHTDDLNYDTDNEGFVAERNELPPRGSLEVFEVSNNNLLGKRGRTEYEENSNPRGNTPESDIFVQCITKLTTIFEGVYRMLENLEHERTYTAWDAIKEVPNLSEDIRLEAFNLLDTKTRTDGFLRMTPGERANWINMMRKS